MHFLAKLVILFYVVEINSHKVKRINRDFSYPMVNEFKVYWNAPTFTCRRHEVYFESLFKEFGIIANENDEFRGEKILILYDPGMFPAVLKDKNTGKLVERNGGIPQLGKIEPHLDAMNTVFEKVVPRNFKGVGVIDFEAWRPIYRQNWNDQVIYKNMSKELVSQKHPQWDDKRVTAQAKNDFESYSRVFMEDTLKLANILRPNGKWGYYGYPYCYNYGKNGTGFECPTIVQQENDQIQWLFDESGGLYPSVYTTHKMSEQDYTKFVTGRMNEAWRMVKKVADKNGNSKMPYVAPYVWYRYHDSTEFLSNNVIYNVLLTISKYKLGGAIIWGSSTDLKSKTDCQSVYDYVEQVLGPAVFKVKQTIRTKRRGAPFVPSSGLPSPSEINHLARV